MMATGLRRTRMEVSCWPSTRPEVRRDGLQHLGDAQHDSAVTEAFFNDGEHYFDKAHADQSCAGRGLNDFQELGWRRS